MVGLEIKRELVVGRLSSAKQAFLPVMAAIGGMLVPAAVYGLLNAGGPGSHGWGVPMATDIAFALGILALFGSRVPIGLKVFLTALAIADELGAVLVIALFYTDRIRWAGLVAVVILLAVLALANRARVRRPGVYLLLALGVWVGVFASGVHATVAGILVPLLVPIRARIDPSRFLDLRREARLRQPRVGGPSQDRHSRGFTPRGRLGLLVPERQASTEGMSSPVPLQGQGFPASASVGSAGPDVEQAVARDRDDVEGTGPGRGDGRRAKMGCSLKPARAHLAPRRATEIAGGAK